MKPKHSSGQTMQVRHLSLGSFVFGAVVILGLSGPLILSSTMGLGFTNVLTGSMTPTLNPGDLVITKLVPASEIEVGDLLSLVEPESYQKFMHRVTSIEVNEGNILFITKGDSNPLEDFEATVVSPASFVPKHINQISSLGSLLGFISTPAGTLLLTGILIISIGGLLLVGRKKNNNQKEITYE
jgi:signal peptidase